MYKYVIVESDCHLDLGYYPFDHQNCQIILAYQGNEGEEEIIKLIADKLSYLGPTTMKQYDIDSVEFESNQDNKIKIAIKFSRNILRELLTIIFPTILIVIVSIHAITKVIQLNNFDYLNVQASFATNYFTEEDFKTIVPVNITAFLCMVTLYIGVSNE